MATVKTSYGYFPTRLATEKHDIADAKNKLVGEKLNYAPQPTNDYDGFLP
ncbi:MAG: hypothetical protein AB4206_18580 [Xenococcaceae cyanobacterium]